MKAYRRHVVIKNPRRVVLADVPFEAGDRVEVLMLAPDETPEAALIELKTLFHTTQTLPQAQALSDEQIAAQHPLRR